MMLKLGVPSKGRLQDDTFAWFEKRGLKLQRTGSDREYTGAVSGVDGIELVLLSAGEIPKELAKGRIHLGVTGTDRSCRSRGRTDDPAYLWFSHASVDVSPPNAPNEPRAVAT